MVKEIAAKLRACHKIAISSHIRPDADSIGSGLALALMLRQLGQEVLFCNTEPAPYPLSRLPQYETIQFRQIYPEQFDAVMLIEGGNEERSGQQHLDRYFSVNIDHHATSSREANLNWIDAEVAAVGELIYSLGLELGINFTRDIAFNLYAAIASDTGSFKYSNTSYRSLQIASDLVFRGGFTPAEVSNLLFNSNPLPKIRMLTQVLNTLELALDNRVAIIHFQRSFLQGLSLRDIETEDIITIIRSIDGVQVVVFFKEVEDDLFRVSIRSRDRFSAQQIAQKYNGGGHHHAAGFFFRGDFQEAKREVLTLIQAQL